MLLVYIWIEKYTIIKKNGHLIRSMLVIYIISSKAMRIIELRLMCQSHNQVA
jgi:hypothetical protein